MKDALHIVCPHCQAVNRIPSTRLHENPKCGQCHHLLFTRHPVELTSSNFQKQVSRNDIPLLIDFWASWCGPCQMMAPQFEQAAALLEPEIRLAKLNTEAEQTLAGRFGIRSIPTLMIIKNGEEIARQAGAMGRDDIVRWAQRYL